MTNLKTIELQKLLFSNLKPSDPSHAITETSQTKFIDALDVLDGKKDGFVQLDPLKQKDLVGKIKTNFTSLFSNIDDSAKKIILNRLSKAYSLPSLEAEGFATGNLASLKDTVSNQLKKNKTEGNVDLSHFGLVEGLSMNDSLVKAELDKMVYRPCGNGFVANPTAHNPNEISEPVHGGSWLKFYLSLVENKNATLGTPIKIKVVKAYTATPGNPKLSTGKVEEKTVTIEDILNGYKSLFEKRSEFPVIHYTPEIARMTFRDTYQILMMMMNLYPKERWNEPWGKNNEFSIHKLMKHYKNYYKKWDGNLEGENVFDHTILHLPEMLLTYYSKMGQDPNELKKLFFQKEMKQDISKTGVPNASHVLQNLGMLLDNPKVVLNDKEKKQVRDYLKKIEDCRYSFTQALNDKREVGELGHLVKGLDLILKNKEKFS